MFLFLAVLLVLVASPVSGLALTFQNSGDFASYATCKPGTSGACSWVDNSATCGNSYVRVFTLYSDSRSAKILNTDPNPTSYAAATIYPVTGGALTPHYPMVTLYNSAGAEMYSYIDFATASGSWYRYEVKMVGGQAKIYRDSTLLTTSGALAQNPSYVGWGGHGDPSHSATYYVDDFVMGDEESGLIFGVPAEGCYIRRDPIGGGSGLYNAAGTLVSTYNMSTTWAKKSDGASATIVLENWGTGVIVDSFATGASTISGTKSWPIADDITDTYDYGYYVVKTNPAIAGVYSRTIPYQMGGATATWNSDYYSTNDIATITTAVSAGYWDTGTYTYTLKITDIYGTEKQSSTITSQNQGTNYQFSTDDTQGVYVAWLYATKISDGTQYLMSQDLTTLVGYVRIEGYAFNATSETILSSVNISVTQSSYSQNQFTSAGGYYNTSASIPFGTGALLTVNATKVGYRQRVITFTPQVAKTINLTIPLEPLSVVHTGIMLRGLVSDNIYTNPVASPVVLARNGTENYSVTANSLGEYIFDDTRGGGMLSNATCYQLFAAKTGYSYVSPTTPTCVYGA